MGTPAGGRALPFLACQAKKSATATRQPGTASLRSSSPPVKELMSPPVRYAVVPSPGMKLSPEPCVCDNVRVYGS
jgi:hypothetical protein